MTESIFTFSEEGLVIESRPVVSGTLNIRDNYGMVIEIPYEFDFSSVPQENHEFCINYLKTICGL